MGRSWAVGAESLPASLPILEAAMPTSSSAVLWLSLLKHERRHGWREASVRKVLAEEQAEPTWKVGVGGRTRGQLGLADQLAYCTWQVPMREPVRCLRNGTQGCPLVSVCMGMHTCLVTDVKIAWSRRKEPEGVMVQPPAMNPKDGKVSYPVT